MTALSCAVDNLDEPLPGTAPGGTTFVMLEHGGPWPEKPLACLEPAYAQALGALPASIGLIRRPDAEGIIRQGVPDHPVVLVSAPGLLVRSRPAAYPSADELADVIDSVERGEVPRGWEPVPYAVAICTHAKRDVCCSRLGIPLAEALLALDAEHIWTTTHLGGHRFAATCLALPAAVYYGRVPVERASELLDAVRTSRVLPDLMRGSGAYAPALQAAEIGARRVLAETGPITLVSAEGPASTWQATDASVVVVVEERQGDPRKASCAKDKLSRYPEFFARPVDDEPAYASAAPTTINALAARIDALHEGSRPVVVAVDGRSAAGKSTLAGALAAGRPGWAVVHTDDVAWWHSYFDWADLLTAGVLAPAHQGRPVSYRPPAWDERGRDGAVEVPAGTRVLVVEGVGSSRAELRPWLDLAVWVHTPVATVLDREAERIRTGHTEAALSQDWLPAEAAFLAADRPWSRADVVVSGTSGATTPVLLSAQANPTPTLSPR